MSYQMFQVDAFTDAPFRGNPAAVCVLPAAAEEPWMQLVAREMNLSETAFLVRRDDDSYDLRWFTPAVEVDLCGHATLASAHVLWERHGHLGQATFHTRSGDLTAAQRDGWIELDFPALPPEPVEPPASLIDALGLGTAHFVGKSRFDYIVEAADEMAVRSLSPDLRRLPQGTRGVIVTAQANDDSGFDFVSRFFAPGAGIDEDPVTGSAHCVLAPYWAKKLGKARMHAYQASARGGVVGVEMRGERVLLRGQAVTVMAATLLVD